MGDTIVIIALAAVVIAFVAIGAAVAVTMKQAKIQRDAPEIRTTATVLRTMSDHAVRNENFSSGTVDSAGGFEVSSSYVEFALKDGKTVRFKLKKKDWLRYHDGDFGTLTYKGRLILDFQKRRQPVGKEEETFFPSRPKTEPAGTLYGEAKRAGFVRTSDKPVAVDGEDLAFLVGRLGDDPTDWFFVLTRKNGDVLQVERSEGDAVEATTTLAGVESLETIPFDGLLARLKRFLD
ncbi:MAG: DUF2500 family protein [Candidatus Izemoplasmatales bacterium]